MAAANVVEILVKSSNDTGPGFAEAKGGAAEVAAAMDEYAAASEEASGALAQVAEKQAALAELQASGTASAEEVAAAEAAYAGALDKSTSAALRSMDAQIKLGDAELAQSAAARGAGDAAEVAGGKAETSGGLMAGMGSKVKMAALGAAVGLGLAVKGAADFQQQTVRLVTSAGESAKNLGMVQRGILSLSSSTNTSTSDLAKGMYMVESAGFHGAQGLTVLKAAAQGAQAEGADLGEVANAVTSGLNAYGMKASQATSFTNQMVAAVGAGKMTMQDLASSMSAVLPIAASAHISFAQVGGAVATMTAQGMSARQATQDLANMIRNILHPSGAAAQEMRALGLNANELNHNIGHAGLTGTLQTLTEAILRNTHGGNVLVGYMHSMTPAAQGLARQILSGTISTKQLQTAVKGLNPEQAKLISLFENSATSATGLKQTFDGAMASMTGGATGLNVALMLGGTHMGTFEHNVKAVGDAAHGAGGNVRGWGDIQKEANFQIGSATKAVKAMGDSLGLALLPSVTAVLRPLTSMLGAVAHNKAASIAFAAVVGSVLAGALGSKLVGALKDAKSGLGLLFDGLTKIPGAVSGVVSGFASAAGSVASFVSGMVSKLAEAASATAAWIAENIAAGAAFIATNVAEAAAATAAFIAENLATLGIAAAIAALIAVIIYLATHWKQVWSDIKKWALDAWHFLDRDVLRPIQHAIADVVDWIKGHWKLLVEILTGPIGIVVLWLKEHWHQIETDVSDMIGNVIRFFDHLRDSIWHAISSLPGMLWKAGVNAITALWHGAESVFSGLLSTAESWGHDIANAIGAPFGIHFSEPSEASKMVAAGRRVAEGLGTGMSSGTPGLRAAALRMAGAAMPAIGAGGGRGGYGPGAVVTIQLEWAGGHADGEFMTWLARNIRAGGGDPRILNRKVVLA